MFKMQIMAVGAMAIAGGGFYAVSEMDKGMNYTKTEAEIVSVKVDCFIKTREGKKTRSVVKKGTEELAYMPCAIAPRVAVKFGHKKESIKKRAKVKYAYVSPADNMPHEGNFTKTYRVEKYKEGGKMVVFAHNKKPGKSRIN